MCTLWENIMSKKILIIRFSSIGDIVLASPVFRCIKKQLANTEIHFVTKLSFKAVTIANPYIDKFFYYNDNMDELLAKLTAENYDHVIDLHNNFRSNKIKRFLKKDTYTIDKLNTQKLLLTQLNIDIMPNRHITQRSLDTISALNVKDDGNGLDYFIPEKEQVNSDDLPTGHLAGYIAIAIGASFFTKRMPTHKIIEICSKINHPIILVGGKDDEANGTIIANSNSVKIYNACGKFSLNESADIVKKAKLVISNDTGMLYIACAFKIPTIALWGSTTPDLDVEPYYGSSFKIDPEKPVYSNIVLGLNCQPCSKYGLQKCPKEHFNCMQQIDVNEVVEKVKVWL